MIHPPAGFIEGNIITYKLIKSGIYKRLKRTHYFHQRQYQQKVKEEGKKREKIRKQEKEKREK